MRIKEYGRLKFLDLLTFYTTVAGNEQFALFILKFLRKGYVCRSLRHFENKFNRAPVGLPIETQRNYL